MKSAYITSRSESDRRARQIAREEVERQKAEFCPDCMANMERQTISIMCKVLHDNYGFDKEKLKDLISAEIESGTDKGRFSARMLGYCKLMTDGK
jgi:hypothetical protein